MFLSSARRTLVEFPYKDSEVMVTKSNKYVSANNCQPNRSLLVCIPVKILVKAFSNQTKVTKLNKIVRKSDTGDLFLLLGSIWCVISFSRRTEVILDILTYDNSIVTIFYREQGFIIYSILIYNFVFKTCLLYYPLFLPYYSSHFVYFSYHSLFVQVNYFLSLPSIEQVHIKFLSII